MGDVVMSAATEAYERLMAARRPVPQHETDERERESAREQQQARIKRRLPKVY